MIGSVVRRFYNYKEPEEGVKKKKRVIDLTASVNSEESDMVIENWVGRLMLMAD